MTLPRKLIAAFILLALVVPCAAQGPKIGRGNPKDARLDEQAYGRGTDAFRRLLFELRFQPVPSFADFQNIPPEQSLFIMLGEPICLSGRYFLNEFPKGLRNFVERGGAVLIATDKETKNEAGEELSKLAGVRVTGQTLVFRQPSGAGDPIPCYNNSDYCPLLEPIKGLTAANGSMSIMETLTTLLGAGGQPDLFRRDPQPGSSRLQVATNAPSRLMATQDTTWWLTNRIHCLARLPSTCENENGEPLDPNGSQTRGSLAGLAQNFTFNDPVLFAVGGTVGKGRVLVLADHSIFINRMMLPREINNLEFAANCLHWLRGGVSTPMEAARAAVKGPDALPQLMGQRTHVLFWDDGKVHKDFNVPLKKVSVPPTLPPEPAIVAAIDKTIAKLEDEDYFNSELLAGLDDLAGGRQRLLRSVVYLLTLAAFLFLAYRFLWRARYRPETAAPLLADAVSQHEPRVTLLDQRRRALLRLGNVWEMGHCLARECFESAGVALTGASPPRVTMTQGSWRQRWRIRRRVARLWRLACGNTPVPLSPAALHHRVRELEELKTALANGTIKLT
jgi:hypothetical protein